MSRAHQRSLPALWRKAKRWAGRGVALTTKILGTLFIVWIVWLLADALLGKHRVDIEAIGVPKSLVKAGFSGEVATRRLRDAVKAIDDRVHTTMKKSDVEVGQPLPDVTIPAAGVSVAGVAASIRRLLPKGWRNDVSGEFTVSGAQLALRLRVNDEVVFQENASDSDPCHPLSQTNAIDTLIDRGALRLVEKIQPFIAAVYYHEVKCDAAAEALANRIIMSLPNDDENVAHAYNMKGVFAYQRHDYNEALEYLQAAADKTSISLDNIGDFFARFGKYDIALAKFREALRLDHTSAEAHFGIAAVWDATRSPGAVGTPAEEFSTDPQFGLTSVDVGFWSTKGTADQSIAEYRRALWLDPTLPDAHYNLGDIYRDQGNLNGAIAEYREGIRIENAHARYDGEQVVDPYVNLAIALQTLGRRAEAIDYLREAVRLDPKAANLQYLLGVQLKELAGSATEPERSSNLRDACAAIVQATMNTGNGKDDRQFREAINSQIAEIDKSLDGNSHCPPQSGATIQLHWEPS